MKYINKDADNAIVQYPKLLKIRTEFKQSCHSAFGYFHYNVGDERKVHSTPHIPFYHPLKFFCFLDLQKVHSKFAELFLFIRFDFSRDLKNPTTVASGFQLNI